MVSMSTHFRSFSEEIPDNQGGFKCGKVPRKDFDDLSDAEKVIQKEIKTTKVLFGTVTMGAIKDHFAWRLGQTPGQLEKEFRPFDFHCSANPEQPFFPLGRLFRRLLEAPD